MRILLDSNSNDPNYLQIENAIRSAICQGQLWPQEQLPSIRQLAKQLQVAIITVKRAYDDLEQAGLLSKEQRWRENGGRSSLLYTLKVPP